MRTRNSLGALAANTERLCGLELDSRRAQCWTVVLREDEDNVVVSHPQTIGGTWRALSVGPGIVCGVSLTKSVVCNAFGETGIPITRQVIDKGAESVAAGFPTCWSGHGGVSCDDGTRPIRKPASLISGDGAYKCALVAGGAVRCWGNQRQRSSTAALRGIRTISVAGEFACALAASSDAMCWGLNDFGVLGDGTVPAAGGESRNPRVIADWTFRSISVGADGHVCAITIDRRAACWGNNGQGQLGDGSFTNRGEPVFVSVLE